MEAKQLLKVAEKALTKRKIEDAVAALLHIFVQKPNQEHDPAFQRIYEKAGLYFAKALTYKEGVPSVLKLIKGAPQDSLIFIGHIAAEFGQLGGAINLVTTAYDPLKMDLPLFNFLTDILDSFNDRKRALSLSLEYCKSHPIANIIRDPKPEIPVEYLAEELLLLELYFKLIKLSYTLGELSLTREWIETTKPAVLQGKDLHLTSVRNGNSYFGYLSTLLALNTKQANSDLPTLYCVGDSHSLSLGFETLKIKDTHYYIKPGLVTGCKIWHLRPGSQFHAKQNFEKVVAALPNQASVMFLFGEIDCREGMLKAVAKGLYPSIPAAIKVLLTIYFDKIETVRKAKNLQLVLIHPVPPVLNETRTMVRLFNQMLKEKAQNYPHLVFIDIENDLLTEEGLLKPEYNLDGTHLNPAYKGCIEDFLK